MIWWLLIPAVLTYVAVGLAVARRSFVVDLGEAKRFQRDDCFEKYCVHKITMIDGRRHRPTTAYQAARDGAAWIGGAWLPLALVCAVVAPFILICVAFDRVLDRPTKAEKLTQRQRDLAALSTKAKELGLPVPEEWGQDSDPMGGIVPAGLVEKSQLAKDREWIDQRTMELAKLRNPERYERELST